MSDKICILFLLVCDEKPNQAEYRFGNAQDTKYGSRIIVLGCAKGYKTSRGMSSEVICKEDGWTAASGCIEIGTPVL